MVPFSSYMRQKPGTKTLVEVMKQQLPIPACPTIEAHHFLLCKGMQVRPDRDLMIIEVFNTGDDIGGIMCAIQGYQQPIIISLTDLLIKPDHPLRGRIEAYQKERIKHLSCQGNQSYYEYTLQPKH